MLFETTINWQKKKKKELKLYSKKFITREKDFTKYISIIQLSLSLEDTGTQFIYISENNMQ